MKNQIISTLFLIFAVSVEASAWTFWVDGTNHVELAFEDASLSAEERNFIETDIQRLFALKNLRLSKHFTPGQDPDDDVSQFLSDFGNASFHFPSLLDFKIRAGGPTNSPSRSFLWGIIPYCDTQEVSGLPIIYYQNRWWYSVWFWEEGEQEW